MNDAIIVDLDSTLVDVSNALKYVSKSHPEYGGKKNWHLFNEEAVESSPIECVVSLVNSFAITHKVIIMTGRKEQWREHTIRWLEKNHIEYEELHMRNNNDDRKVHLVKKDMLDRLRHKYNFEIAIDDYEEIIEMFKDEGLLVIHVK